MQHSEKILKQHHLRITPIRQEILRYFQQQKSALAHAQLETHFANKFDRVTIYRTLTSFLENGLLHKIPDDTGVAKYALCHHADTKHTHDDDHVHFKCNNCNNIECLHTAEIPAIKLPDGYRMKSANLLIEGTCSKCNV